MRRQGRSQRRPAVAGLFYPADADACFDAAEQFVRVDPVKSQGREWRGGIVPHAGWVCSGAVAGETIAAIKVSRERDPDVVVVFGAVHTPLPLDRAALASHDQWLTPGALFDVPQELSSKLMEEQRGAIVVDNRFHENEHAVEVELPLIRQAWPAAMVLPVEVPLIDAALNIGTHVARLIEKSGLDAVYLASSDLTHYGPNYRFTPAGVGLAALAWAKENDRKLLDKLTHIAPETVVPEVRASLNACGGGAIAAMLAAARERGIVEARVLRHTSSYETLADVAPQSPDNAVGYASVVIG